MLSLFLAGSGLADSRVNRWSANGPFGSLGYRLALNPLKPDTLYLGTFSGKIFRTTDAGMSWQQVYSGSDLIRCLAADPQRAEVAYAGTSYGNILQSTDSGATWHSVFLGFTGVYCLAIDPHDSDIIYAGTYGDGVVKSTDGGATWAEQENELFDQRVISLVIDPRTTTTLYAGTYGAGIYRSADGGLSWQASNSGLNNLHIAKLAIVPDHPEQLFAVSTFLYRSEDGGWHWQLVDLPTGTFPTNVVVDPSASHIVYLLTYTGVLRSVDGGYTWTVLPFGVSGDDSVNVWDLMIGPEALGSIYIATSEWGMVKSTDGGATWSTANEGMTDVVVPALAADPWNVGKLYAGSDGSGVFVCLDGGAHWQPSPYAIHYGSARCLVFDHTQPDTIYGCGYASIFRTTDGGASWQVLHDNILRTYETIYQDFANPMILFVGSHRDGVLKSINGGISWTSSSTGITDPWVDCLAVSQLSPSFIYSGTYNGLYVSTNSGQSWELVPLGLSYQPSVLSIAFHPIEADIIFVGTYSDGIRVSRDGGITWEDASRGLTVTGEWPASIDSIVIRPDQPNIMYAASSGDGVFRSLDGGQNWQQINSGLPTLNVRRLAIDPSDPERLYAGLQDYGVGTITISADINGDGHEDAADLVTLSQYLADNLPLLPLGESAGDVSINGRVDVLDLMLLERLLVFSP